MTRTRLIAEATTFALAQPFAIARGTREAIELVTVSIEREGVTGRGEGAPSARYGQDARTVLAAIEAMRPRVESGIDRAQLLAAMSPGSARNAIDCALWDLEAKLAGQPEGPLATPLPTVLPSAVTVGIAGPAAMAARAREVTAQGSARAVLKVKLDARDIAARLRAVREAAPEARIIVDANESWDRRTLEAALPVLVETDVRLLEQPLPAGEDARLAGLSSPVPLACDESAHVAADVARLAPYYDYVTIKLDKSGGLTAALELADAAQAAGMGLMTGCMLCSSLSVAAAWPIAARSSFIDLDGPLWLARDRAGGAVLGADGLHAPAGLNWAGSRYGSPASDTRGGQP